MKTKSYVLPIPGDVLVTGQSLQAGETAIPEGSTVICLGKTKCLGVLFRHGDTQFELGLKEADVSLNGPGILYYPD